MSTLRTIEIDFDVHKRIEMERRSFDEPANAALRRLLGIDGTESNKPIGGASGRPWSGKGVTLDHGTDVRMEYNGRQHTGRIDDGEWLVEGQRYGSPSAAAGGVARTKVGTRPSLDGWIYWEVRRPGSNRWVGLKDLRNGQRN